MSVLGVQVQFMKRQKKSTYKLVLETKVGRYRCPYCGSNKKDPVRTDEHVPNSYVTESDIERIHPLYKKYPYTTDYKCMECKKLFSMEASM